MFKVHILGTSSATPAYTRNTTAQVVEYSDRYYLVDCGEGTQIQFRRYRIKFSRLDAIFISHTHGDHILGLPGLLSSLSIFERDRPLKLFGPKDLKVILDTFFELSDTFIKYPLEFYPLEDFEPGETLMELKRFRIKSFPLTHRAFCRGFMFEEHSKKPKFDFFKAKDMDIPKEYFGLLKQGNTITLKNGTVVKPEEVLIPAAEPLSYAFCSDTQYEEGVVPYIKGATILYHETTFTEQFKERAIETQHSTALDAGKIAALAQVKNLLIGHYSARYRDLTPLLEEAQSVFERTLVSKEGMVLELKNYV